MFQQLAAAGWALRRVAANRDIRRAELAWMLGWAAEWAWLVALFVFAYGIGGVGLVGALGLIRTLPAALLAPALSTLADRRQRQQVLLSVHAGRALLVGAAALGVSVGWPWWVVLAIAPLDGLLAVLHRPAHMSLMPSLARAPEDLVAANVASSTLEAVGILSGPAVGGLLVASGVAALPFAVPAAAFACAAGAVAVIRPARALQPGAPPRPIEVLLGGLHAVARYPHAALMLGLFGLQTLVRGLLSVLLVVAAIELLGMGEQGVGYLNAAIGAGGFIGALLAMALVGRARLAPPVLAGLLLWGLPILAIGALPLVVLSITALAVLGAGNAVLDVAGFTLLQRTVPNAVRGRIFGLLEAIVMLTVGVGAALAPALIGLLGTNGALIVTGAILPVAALLAWPRLRQADDRAVIPARELQLLRQVPMLQPLPLTVLEDVAGQLSIEHFAAGARVISEGEAGDRFFIIADGVAEASGGGHVLSRMESGDSFGEIALLRDVPRTASVMAVTDVEAMTLSRAAFLATVTGDHHSLAAAEGVVERRLAASG